MQVTEFKPLLSALFDKYVESTMEYCRRNFKYVVQLPAIAQAQIVCKILDGILPKEQVRNLITLPMCVVVLQHFANCLSL